MPALGVPAAGMRPEYASDVAKRARTAAGIGGAIAPRKPLNRYVKWPKYVRIQRQRRVLSKRLKVRNDGRPSRRSQCSSIAAAGCSRLPHDSSGAAVHQPVL